MLARKLGLHSRQEATQNRFRNSRVGLTGCGGVAIPAQDAQTDLKTAVAGPATYQIQGFLKVARLT